MSILIILLENNDSSHMYIKFIEFLKFKFKYRSKCLPHIFMFMLFNL